jgi:hypothetical protein
MANALRRKMFKLGGSANTHGVGITSGLKMKKGGKVEPQATFGVGNNALRKIGPDGKEREAHVAFLPFLAPGLSTLLRLSPRLLSGVRSGKGLESLSRFFRAKPTGPRAPGKVTPGGKATMKEVLESIKKGGGDFSKIGITPGARALTYADRLKQAARIGGAGIAGGAGLGALSSVLPEFDDSPDDTFLENVLDVGRSGAEGALDFMTYLPSTIVQAPFRKFEDIQGTSGAIRSLLYGDKKDKDEVGSSLVDKSDSAKAQKEQKDEFAGLSDKAARMAAAISKENNLATLSQAAADFGASALAGQDLATALRTGSQPIFDELGRRRDFEENIGGILAQQVLADEATQGAMIAEAAKTGDPNAVLRMQKYFDGYNEGVTNILPIDAKGGIDYSTMAPGTVYMDLEGVSGSRYVAANADGTDTEPFDSIEDANAFAQS